MLAKASRKKKSKRRLEREKADRDAAARDIADNIHAVVAQLAGISLPPEPDAVSAALDRCSLAVEELQTLREFTLADTDALVALVQQINDNMDRLDGVFERVRRHAEKISQERKTIEALQERVNRVL